MSIYKKILIFFLFMVGVAIIMWLVSQDMWLAITILTLLIVDLTAQLLYDRK